MFLHRSFVLKLLLVIIVITFALFCLPKILHAQMIEKTFDIKDFQNRTHRIFIAVPDKGAATDKAVENQKYPAIFLLDGNKTYQIARLNNPKAVLVGIGYPTSDNQDIVQQRFFDLTIYSPKELVALRPGMQVPKTGGDRDFRAFIAKKLVPNLVKNYPINEKKLTLFGHSLGGLFVMNTVISNDAGLFQTYCAADPSIWWNKHAFMTSLQNYNLSGRAAPKILIEISGQNTKHNSMDKKQMQHIQNLRSGPNGQDVAKILAKQKMVRNSFYQFANLNHGTMLEPSIQDCLAFALYNKTPKNSNH